MNVLVACEESQEVCKAFRARGHRAFSCDLIPCRGGCPEWHVIQDVLPLLDGNCDFVTEDGTHHSMKGPWDLIIAHPPCTDLASSGARWFPEKIRDGRQQRAVDFFMRFVDAKCDRIAIENPVGIMSGRYRKPDQIIQPYMFGDPARKATCLWLKGLPKLEPTNVVEPKLVSYHTKDGRTVSFSADYGVGFNRSKESQRRAKTYPGIAQAMADTWGS